MIFFFWKGKVVEKRRGRASKRERKRENCLPAVSLPQMAITVRTRGSGKSQEPEAPFWPVA